MTSPAQDPKVIVIIDDNEQIRVLVRRALQMKGYIVLDWATLLELWRTFNLHLADLMECTPAAVSKKSYIKHNLDQIGFRPMKAVNPATLDWFMEDYVEHLKHHLAQIDRVLSP